MFVRSGSIVAMRPHSNATIFGSAQLSFEHLELWAFAISSASATWIYEDDGMSNAYLDGSYSNTTVTAQVWGAGGGGVFVGAAVSFQTPLTQTRRLTAAARHSTSPQRLFFIFHMQVPRCV